MSVQLQDIPVHKSLKGTTVSFCELEPILTSIEMKSVFVVSQALVKVSELKIRT